MKGYNKKRYLCGSVILFSILLLTACTNAETDKEKWEDVKSTENVQSTENIETELEQGLTEAQNAAKQPTQEDIVSILGNIESIGDKNFIISQVNTVKTQDGSDLAIKEDEAALITVNFTGTTEFVICSSSDGGITSSETAASSQDLVSEGLVRIEGNWNQNDFEAQKIIIFHFN